MTAISDKSELCRLHQTLLSLESTTEVQKLDSKIILSLLEENYRLQEELKKQKELEAADRADVEAYKKCSEYFKEENARLREALAHIEALSRSPGSEDVKQYIGQVAIAALEEK